MAGKRGAFAATDRTELTSLGRGRGALLGVSVKLVTRSEPAGDGAPCDAAVGFTGHGKASAKAERNPVGAVVVTSARDFDATLEALVSAVDANPGLGLVKTVDHRAAAAGRDLVLPPTTELFFGNPAIGTPLMQASQLAGIDLPQKMLVWEDLLGVVRVAYNAPSYLRFRHRIVGANTQLETVARALAGLASAATGTGVDPVLDAGRVRNGAGIVTVSSDRSVDDAFAAIVDALEQALPVNVSFTVAHDDNATSIGMDLRPTKLVVFGNPSLGTVLMPTDQSVALDLPRKILVFEDADGRTVIAYNNPGHMARRHRIRGQAEVLKALAGALATFAAAGT